MSMMTLPHERISLWIGGASYVTTYRALGKGHGRGRRGVRVGEGGTGLLIGEGLSQGAEVEP